MKQKGITLIGMPTSGKTTIGKEVAQRIGWPLLDIDQCMEAKEGMALGEVIAKKGAKYTLNLETEFIHATPLMNTVVSTPGSIIYNDVFDTLEQQTEIVWLDVSLDEIKHRLATDPNPDRINTIIGAKEKGLEPLFNVRVPLYKKWAKHTIDCNGKDVAEIASEVIRLAFAKK